jgi:predicted PurR-regulated permease PerM
VATIGLFVIALLWGAYAAQPVIVPVLRLGHCHHRAAAGQLVQRARRAAHPRGAGGHSAAGDLVRLPADAALDACRLLVGRASEVGALVKEKLQTMTQPLALLQELQKSLNAIGAGGGAGQPTLKVEQQSASVVATIFSVLTPAVSEFILFIGALVFYLVYQKRLRSAVVRLLNEREARLATLRTLSDIDQHMTTYFGTFTIVNVCLGVVTVALTWMAGLPNPLLWGVLAAVLNYIPYIGPAIVTATLAVVALRTYPSLGEALIAPAIFIAVVTVEGQFLTPALMGRRLELNPFAVFLAIAFCTWLWGPVGASRRAAADGADRVIGHAFADEGPDLPD